MALNRPVRIAAAGPTRPEARPIVSAIGRVGVGIVVVAATVVAVGVGPFLHGIASLTPLSVVAAVVLVAVATAAAAWRWRVVSTALGLPLAWTPAVGAYYRSQFLNSVLPGGVLGDVHRAYAHGRDGDRMGIAARAVAAERAAGQVVQVVLTLAILLPIGLGTALAPAAGIAAAAVVVALGVLLAVPRGRRLTRRELGMLRPLIARPAAMFAVVAASVVVVAAHVATFVVAGAAVGVPVRPGELCAVALVVLGASAIPLNVGGWGPREAASAAAFAFAGLGGAAGVAVSTAFGVLAMVAVMPGALVLVGERIRRRIRARRRAERPIPEGSVA